MSLTDTIGKQIVRARLTTDRISRVIAFLPVYAIGAFISIYLYRVQPYVAPVPDYYEGFSVVAIFLLFVTFIAPDDLTREHVLNDIAALKSSTPSKKGLAKSGTQVFRVSHQYRRKQAAFSNWNPREHAFLSFRLYLAGLLRLSRLRYSMPPPAHLVRTAVMVF